MKKKVLFCAFTFTLCTAYGAQESESTINKLETLGTAIIKGIDRDPANTHALEDPCHIIEELLETSGLSRTWTFDDLVTQEGVSILNALLSSAIRLNLQEFPYGTLKLLLEHRASHNISGSQFFETLLDLEQASKDGNPCPAWIESVGNFTCSWCKEHDVDYRCRPTDCWREKHDALSLAQEREHRAGRIKTREQSATRRRSRERKNSSCTCS